MWLEVGPTNNDTFVFGQYYLDCVRQLGGIPKITIQQLSFLFGKSSANEHIEAWWGILRR